MKYIHFYMHTHYMCIYVCVKTETDRYKFCTRVRKCVSLCVSLCVFFYLVYNVSMCLFDNV